MAVYKLDTYVTPEGALPTVIAAMKTKQETIVNDKTIRMNKIVYLPNGKAVGILIYDIA